MSNADLPLLVKDSRIKCGLAGAIMLVLIGMLVINSRHQPMHSFLIWCFLLPLAIAGLVTLSGAFWPRLRFMITRSGIWTKKSGIVEWAAVAHYYHLVLHKRYLSDEYLVFLTTEGQEVKVALNFADADLADIRAAIARFNTNPALHYSGYQRLP